MSSSYPGRNSKISILDKEQQSLRLFLSKLTENNNICNLLFQREVGGYKKGSGLKNSYGVNYRNDYNFKKRRFIIVGKDCFVKMWQITDIVFELLQEKETFKKETFKKETLEKDNVKSSSQQQFISANRILSQTGRQPSTKFIKRHCNLLNIKDQIHIIEKGQPLDNTDEERIKKCFLLIIIDYSSDYSDDIRGNYEYYHGDHRILEQIIREDSLDPDFINSNQRIYGVHSYAVNDHRANIQNQYEDRVIPEIISLYNSETKQKIYVFNKNICYVSTKKVLYHNSWINVSELN